MSPKKLCRQKNSVAIGGTLMYDVSQSLKTWPGLLKNGLPNKIVFQNKGVAKRGIAKKGIAKKGIAKNGCHKKSMNIIIFI